MNKKSTGEIANEMLRILDKREKCKLGDISAGNKFHKAQYGTYGKTCFEVYWKNKKILGIDSDGEGILIIPKEKQGEKVGEKIAEILGISVEKNSKVYFFKRRIKISNGMC